MGYWIAWNEDPNLGIKSGADGLLNIRGDKYLFPIDFGPSQFTSGIPSYPIKIVILNFLGFSWILTKKMKSQKR